MRRRTSIAAALLAAAGMTVVTPATPATAAFPTIVVLQFDDGYADQYAALASLNAHGLHATFFVNSGPITAGDPAHMSWAQVQDLYAAGNEIAGHTVDHANVKKLKTAAARHQVCDDRVALFGHGFQPTSFAYPFGSFDGRGSGTGLRLQQWPRRIRGRREKGVRRDDSPGEPVRDPHAAERQELRHP